MKRERKSERTNNTTPPKEPINNETVHYLSYVITLDLYFDFDVINLYVRNIIDRRIIIHRHLERVVVPLHIHRVPIAQP